MRANRGYMQAGAILAFTAAFVAAPIVRAQELSILPRKIPAPSLDGGTAWLNTPAPLSPQALRGKFVLLDFWTYCCINCRHILPSLKQLEHAYPKNLVVIGVHSAKFANERLDDSVRQAIVEYGIEHPVINDPDRILWQKFGATVWPSLRLIDPEGNIVASAAGEVSFEAMSQTIKKLLPQYRRNKTLDETPLVFDYERMQAKNTPLLYPGKVLADAASGRLFISDTSHNRIVVCTLEGKLLATIGRGAIGRADGAYDEAEFDHPQGMALLGDTLYVADTENHLLRRIDLTAQNVVTIAGTGKQRLTPRQWAEPSRRSIGAPAKIPLNSPWALCVQGDWLYIAMAGAHQIWRMSLDEKKLELHAGSGEEDVVDGALTGRSGLSCFAQPSGLATDGERLYVADSEGSSIRAVPFRVDAKVLTVLGTPLLAKAVRLFTFGGQEGGPGVALFQHPLDVAWQDGRLYIADTYNHKIRLVDLNTQTSSTFAGEFDTGARDDPPLFNAPGGLSVAGSMLYVADTNNHAVRVIELSNPSRATTLKIEGLDSPRPTVRKKPPFTGAKKIKSDPIRVSARDGAITVRISLELPFGSKLNAARAGEYWIDVADPAGPIDRNAIGELRLWDSGASDLEFSLPVTAADGEETLEISVAVLYCGVDNLCRAQNLVFTAPVKVSPDSPNAVVELSYKLD